MNDEPIRRRGVIERELTLFEGAALAPLFWACRENGGQA